MDRRNRRLKSADELRRWKHRTNDERAMMKTEDTELWTRLSETFEKQQNLLGRSDMAQPDLSNGNCLLREPIDTADKVSASLWLNIEDHQLRTSLLAYFSNPERTEDRDGHPCNYRSNGKAPATTRWQVLICS